MDETFNSSSNHSDTNVPCSSNMTVTPSCLSNGLVACEESLAISKKSKSSYFLHDILDMKSSVANEKNQVACLMPSQELNGFSIISNLASNSSLANNLAFRLAFNNSLKSSYESTLQAVSSNVSRHRLVECVVCHDKSSGKHYGQFTCEGCKSFFKRSVRRNLTYQCRSAKNCPIDQHHRNQCQHCRFKKCIKMGMRREAVQRGRTPMIPSAKSSLNMAKQKLESKISTEQSDFCTNKQTWPSLIALLPAVQTNDLMNNFLSKTILNIFEWTLSMPIFSTISANDRFELLINAWPELFVVFSAQSNIAIDELRLPTSTKSTHENEEDAKETDNTDDEDSFENFKFQLSRIRSLNLDYDECNYFKAIVLFNPDSLKLESRDLIENYQNNFQMSLSNLTNVKDKTRLRFGKILLSLKSTSRFVYTHSIERLFFKSWLSAGSNSEFSIETIIRKILKWDMFSSQMNSLNKNITRLTPPPPHLPPSCTNQDDYSNQMHQSEIPALLNAYYTSFIANKKTCLELNNFFSLSNSLIYQNDKF